MTESINLGPADTGVRAAAAALPEHGTIPALPFIPGMPSKLPRQPPCTKPNNTLYINNINEKISITDLKQALETIFKTYGDILEIRANGSLYRKGQAYVTFKAQEDAAKALKEAHGFVLFGKPLMIQYARFDSYTTVASQDRDLEEYKAQYRIEKEKRDKELAQMLASEKSKPAAKPAAPFGYMNAGMSAGINLGMNVGMPNKILFLQQVPRDATKEELELAFGKFAGFVEVRTVPGRADIAFVEYDNDGFAAQAKAALGPNWLLRSDQPHVLLSFARR